MVEDAGQVPAAEALLREAARLYEKDEESCQHLLTQADALYERHQAGRASPFNVFSVLRSESDEVNLHSRFLAALLKHRKAHDKPRANLEDFLRNIVGWDDFDFGGSRVERERNNIDILISNSTRQAVVIENKIWAGDQHRQLQRYHESLKERGLEDKNIRLLYLTLHGHDPSEDSAGALDVACISYANTLPPWLERCQERAYAEPGLRESIEQYHNLVRKLTGTDWTEEYMTALKDLSIKGDNPRLIHDLARALVSKKIDLLELLLRDIEGALKESIPKLPSRANLKESNRDRITGYVERSHGHYQIALHYPLGKEHTGAFLCVTIDESEVFFGIACHKSKHQDVFERLQHILKGFQGHSGEEWLPWFRRVDPNAVPEEFKRDELTRTTWRHVEFLCDEGRRKTLAASIAKDLKPIWDTVQGNTTT